jgi:hypothetical protein
MSVYEDRLAVITRLELSAEGLARYAALPPARRRPEEVERALTWAAQKIAAQSQLIAQMRVAIQPFAMAAPSWKGHDGDVIYDGRGFQLKLHHFRQANRVWHSQP